MSLVTRRRSAVVAVLALCASLAVSCGGGDGGRDRNAQTIAGQPCAKLGESKTVSKVVNVCGRNGIDLAWYAAVGKNPTGGKCTRPGGFRTAGAKSLVCAVINKKRMWVEVAPLPLVTETTLAAGSGDVSASGGTVVESMTSVPVAPSTTVAPATTVPAVEVIPSKPIDPATAVAVAKASAPATRLSLVTKAITSRNGDPMFPAPVVQLVDDAGQARPVAGVRVRAVLAVDGYEVTGDVAVTTADGSATFPELRALGAAGRIDVSFVAIDYGGATQAVTHEIGEAVSLKWMQFSGAATAGAQWATQPGVQLVDAAGQAVKRSGVNLVYVATLGKGKPSPLGMTETDTDGFGIFRGVSIETAGQFATRVVAPAESLESPSLDVSISADTAKGLVVTSNIPDTMGSAVSYGDVTVQVVDRFGNQVRQAGVRVSAQATSWDFGTEVEAATLKANDADGYGVAAVTNAEGIASFKNFSITALAGVWDLVFQNRDDATWRASVTKITLHAGLPVALKFAVQPAGFRSGLAPDVVPQIEVVDSAGNRVTPVSGDVTVVADNGVAVDGGKASFDDEGLAHFDKLKLTGRAGDATLSFAAGATLAILTTKVALGYGAVDNFVVTELPSTVTVGDTFTISIQLRDSADNIVKTQGIVAGLEFRSKSRNTTFGVAVKSGNTGTLAFTVDKVTVADDYALTFRVLTDVAPRMLVTTAFLSVRSADAAFVSLDSTDSIETRSGMVFPSAITGQVVDRFGNIVVKAGVRVSVEVLDQGSRVKSAEGLSVLTDSEGRVRFANLKLTALAGTYTLLVSVDQVGRSVIYPGQIIVKPGVAFALKIIRGVAGLVNREYALIQPIIQIVDSAGNDVPQGGVTVTASIGPSASPGPRGTAVTDTNGRATFTKLMAAGDTVGVSSAVTFFATGLTSIQERGATVFAGWPKNFSFGLTDKVASGSVFSRITATDVDGNPASLSGLAVGVALDGTVASTQQLVWTATKNQVGYVYGLAGTKVRIDLGSSVDPSRILATHRFTITTDPQIGDPGPSGGTIFFDGVTTNGNVSMLAVPSISGGGRFLEAAPTSWNVLANVSPVNIVDSLNEKATLTGAWTSTAAGQGGNNTKSIVGQQTTRPAIYGPKLVETLRVGSFDDWWLPSSGEFALMLRQDKSLWLPDCGNVTKFMTSSLNGLRTLANFYDSTTSPWTLKSLSTSTPACIVPIRAFG